LKSYSFNWILPAGEEDDVLNFIVTSCLRLRVFCVSAGETTPGEGWLDSIETRLPLLRCLLVIGKWSDERGPGLLERADHARTVNPKLCVLIHLYDAPGRDVHHRRYRFNENVTITALNVLDILRTVKPRLRDVNAGRFRFSDVLQQAVRYRLALEEEDKEFGDLQ
jgi:hypothetical protein